MSTPLYLNKKVNMEINQLENVIEILKESPLYYLFLSSRELFHTNFWYWLSTLNKRETLRLFVEDDHTDGNLTFKREHNQQYNEYKSAVDLLIIRDHEPYVVIENKVKDFPTTEQIHRIKNSFNDDSIHYVLATLFFSREIVFNGWKVKTYEEISHSIIPENFTSNAYHKSLIQDYKEFIYNLAELARLLPLTLEYDFANTFNPYLFNKLNEIKLWEGYQKLRASHLLFHFNNRNEIETRYSVNHQKATIDFLIRLKDGYLILISLEDNQLRRFVGGKKPEIFAQNLLANGIFFSSDFMGRGQKPFLKYDNKGDTQYRYQYEKIPSPIPFQELFDKICSIMSEVLEQKSLIESNIPED